MKPWNWYDYIETQVKFIFEVKWFTENGLSVPEFVKIVDFKGYWCYISNNIQGMFMKLWN